MKKELVIFKNSPERLLVLLDNEAAFDEIMNYMSQKIYKNRDFFKNATLKLKYKGRELTGIEEELITDLFVRIGGVEVIDIGKEIVLPQNAVVNSRKGIAYGLFEEGSRKPVKKTDSIRQIAEGVTVYYRDNLKKGQNIIYNGSVVIFGNVEKGAFVKADENVIVFGRIKGSVYAGEKNLKTAVIVCEEFDAENCTLAGIADTEEDFALKLKRKQKRGLFRRKRVEMKILSLHNDSVVVDSLFDIIV